MDWNFILNLLTLIGVILILPIWTRLNQLRDSELKHLQFGQNAIMHQVEDVRRLLTDHLRDHSR